MQQDLVDLIGVNFSYEPIIFVVGIGTTAIEKETIAQICDI